MSQYFNEDKLNEDSSKKLIVACSNAKRDDVEKMLEREDIRSAINVKNNMGETALHATATGGDHYIVQLLLDNGADPKISDRQGRTPLMRAAHLENLDAVQVFLAFDESNVYDSGSTGQLPIHCASLLSNMELMNQFLEIDDEGKTLKMRDNEGNDPFLCAAQPPCTVEGLEFLLEHGSDINSENNRGETALLLAARAGANPAIKFLLEKGAVFKAAKNGVTPLHEVCFRKNMEGFKLLQSVQGANTEATTEDGESVLTYACSGGDVEICKALIQKGADMNKCCIHAAARSNRPAIVRLLHQNNVDMNKTNKNGETALIIAVEENEPEMVRLLLECKSDWSIKYNNQEVSPKKPIDALTLAKLRNHKECHKLLTQAKKEGCVIC